MPNGLFLRYMPDQSTESNVHTGSTVEGKNITILAIESSCDETSASICSNGKILSNIIATQKIHEQYGGVVPELASRAHMQNIVPVVQSALQKANTELNSIDAFAFTQSPGPYRVIAGWIAIRQITFSCFG